MFRAYYIIADQQLFKEFFSWPETGKFNRNVSGGVFIVPYCQS